MLLLFQPYAASVSALTDSRRALTELRAAQSYKDLKAKYTAAQFAGTHIGKCETALLSAITNLS